MEIYVVQEGNTVDGIADSFGVDVQQLIEDNQLVYPYALAIGQALLVDTGTDGSTLDKRAVSVSGYAYPFISGWVLEQTLPYLTDLLIFSYGFTAEGQLIPPLWDDTWMISLAYEYDVRPVLVLTPFGADGRFNNRLINAVVNDPEAQNILLDNLLQEMKEKNYKGLDIDFEYILAEDRDAFTAFVQNVAVLMRANGYTTSVALAPKTSADQTGLLYAGKDYGALGAAADHVFLMTYEWGYTYGPPMAVAPINQVRRVVEYALTEIPAEKIELGIPNYGYDWPLPYERGVTKATTLGNIEAVQIAVEQGARVFFDQVAQSPYFRYFQYEEGSGEQQNQELVSVEHEVWYEDVRSLKEKFLLIEQYGLRGCGYWTIMTWFRANWILLSSKFQIDKEELLLETEG